MTSRSYSSNEVGTPAAIARAHSVHAGSLSFPDRESASYQSSPVFQPNALATTLFSPSDVDAATNAPITNPSAWAVKQDWASHQALIKRLYLSENKPLEEVMRLMDSQHGFRATAKMYKMRIKQWGLDKNNKDFEMRAIVRKHKQRVDQGKGSIIRVRGRLRSFAEVVRYWDRKGVSIDDIARQTVSRTPEAVKIFTPGPSPILTPQVLAVPERIFRVIRDYFNSSFESRTWVRTEPHSRCYNIKDKEHVGYCGDELVLQCYTACRLFSRNLFEEAGQTLIAATAKIKNIVLLEHPETLLGVFQLIFNVRCVERDEVALIVLRQFSALGKMLLGSEHPLSRICEWLVSVCASDFDDIVIGCMRCMANQFESFVGPMHRTALISRLYFIELAGQKGDNDIQMLQTLLGQCEKTLQPYDIRILLVRAHLADAYFTQGYYVEARTLGQKNIACSQYFQSENTRLLHQNEGLYMVAKCQYALGEVRSAIENLLTVIDSHVSRYGAQHSLTRIRLIQLEDWYLEQGRWNSAAQVREWREKTLVSVDMD